MKSLENWRYLGIMSCPLQESHRAIWSGFHYNLLGLWTYLVRPLAGCCLLSTSVVLVYFLAHCRCSIILSNEWRTKGTFSHAWGCWILKLYHFFYQSISWSQRPCRNSMAFGFQRICLSLSDSGNQISLYHKFTLGCDFVFIQVLWCLCFLLYKTLNANIW